MIVVVPKEVTVIVRPPAPPPDWVIVAVSVTVWAPPVAVSVTVTVVVEPEEPEPEPSEHGHRSSWGSASRLTNGVQRASTIAIEDADKAAAIPEIFIVVARVSQQVRPVLCSVG